MYSYSIWLYQFMIDKYLLNAIFSFNIPKEYYVINFENVQSKSIFQKNVIALHVKKYEICIILLHLKKHKFIHNNI